MTGIRGFLVGFSGINTVFHNNEKEKFEVPILIIVLTLSGLFYFNGIYPFLTLTNTIPSYLFTFVVLSHDKTWNSALQEYSFRNYKKILITAFPHEDSLSI